MRKLKNGYRKWGLKFTIVVSFIMLFFAHGSMVFGDTITLTNGNVVVGKITSANAQGVDVQTDYGNLTIPKSQIQRIKYEKTPQEKPASHVPAVQPKPQAAMPTVHLEPATQPSVQPQAKTSAAPTQTSVAPSESQAQQPSKTAQQAATMTQPATQAPPQSPTLPGQQRVTVYFKTGEVINGMLLSKTMENISVKSDFGVINIKPNQVQKIVYAPVPHPQSEQKPQPKMVIIYMKNGEILKGELIKKTDGCADGCVAGSRCTVGIAA